MKMQSNARNAFIIGKNADFKTKIMMKLNEMDIASVCVQSIEGIDKSGFFVILAIDDENELYRFIPIMKAHIPVIVVSTKKSLSENFKNKFQFYLDYSESSEVWKTLIDQSFFDFENNKKSLAIDVSYELIGDSEPMKILKKQIDLASNHDTTVLLTGESGTGKEIVAKQIHYNSKRYKKPYIVVNCAAIPADLIESELFGYNKGAFTGASQVKIGKFEAADGGTIFLDEISEMPLILQAKLLRVIQEKKISRLGSNEEKKVDIRIISATNANLIEYVYQNKFREDLFHRINVFPIQLPPLRERAEDIPHLIIHFNQLFYSKYHQYLKFSEQAIDKLKNYHWPGNVRELENLVERLLIEFPNRIIEDVDLESYFKNFSTQNLLKPFSSGISLKEHLSDMEKQYIEHALQQSSGVVAKAAILLGMRSSTLIDKMKKLGIQTEK